MLHKALARTLEEDDGIPRLSRGREGLGLVVSTESQGDQIVSHDGRRVLAIDPDFSRELDGGGARPRAHRPGRINPSRSAREPGTAPTSPPSRTSAVA
jgi:hypothetical protein